jgi:DNA polymerase (family 10)
MNNYEIADHFSLLSKLMDIHGENSFKSKSYSSTAFNIERFTKEIADMDDAELFGQRGIGEATGKKIRELQATGKLGALENMLAVTPPGILDILEVKGLGPKKIAVIWKELGIESLGELEYACNENRLSALKGFGVKTQESILQNIAFSRQNQGYHLWADAEVAANSIVQQMRSAFPENLFELAGDMRRQNETLEFVEIVTDLPLEQLYLQFEPIPDCVMEDEPNERLLVRIPHQPRIRFHLADADTFYHTLFMATGSDEFLSAFLEKYKVPETPETEEQIFAENNLAYIAPMLRETASILDKAAANKLNELIKPNDIKGIIHSHSTWSDGVHTIEQMAKAAIAQGLEYLVISDHSQTAFYAGGLKPDRIAAQHQEIDALNAKLAPFKIFKSIESDILSDGSLDYTDSVLKTFDLVIASVHSNLKMSLEKAMERVLAAIRNPYTTILGHPTGRLLLSRKGYPLDHKKIIEACAEHNVVIEINAHPRRLDMDWRWIEYAMECGVLLSVDPDAHSYDAFRDTYYGVMAAQKGGLMKQSNLSSYSLPEFEAFLTKYKTKLS